MNNNGIVGKMFKFVWGIRRKSLYLLIIKALVKHEIMLSFFFCWTDFYLKCKMMVNVHELKTHERRQRKMVKMIVVLKSKVRWIFSVLRKAEKKWKIAYIFFWITSCWVTDSFNCFAHCFYFFCLFFYILIA